ncbi:MAG: hypothetical protein E3K37_00400 [Candidatus Kuenenia sp.]|nr:hypothetical protein [Candidatus Kuenenia hertensis]
MSCKSSFCLRCSTVYVDNWVSQISKMLHVGVIYRHIVLTVPSVLQRIFSILFSSSVRSNCKSVLSNCRSDFVIILLLDASMNSISSLASSSSILGSNFFMRSYALYMKELLT